MFNPTFAGIELDEKRGRISKGREGGPLASAHAVVDTAGAIESRFTMTRLALMGPFALAFKKKKDKRELYLAVEGDGFAFVVEVDPDKGKKAREFAAKINAAASKAAQSAAVAAGPTRPPASATIPPPPLADGLEAGWHPDPYRRHQHRYFDGATWTEHVSDAGAQSVDPVP